jgi:hypothetical protein
MIAACMRNSGHSFFIRPNVKRRNLCNDGAMKSHTEMIEGPEAFTRFEKAMKKVLAVPHSVIQKRIEEQRRESALNPNRRGPKPKQKRASRVPAV